MKTVYRFYTKPTDEALQNNDDLAIEDKYPLYAFTNKKSLYKAFKETRDIKNSFILIKSEMTDEEYVEFANTSNGNMLSTYSFIHFPARYEDEPIDVKIVCTWNEKEFVQAFLDDGMSEINEDISYDTFPFIFQNKYIKTLSMLQYIGFWKMHGRPQVFREFIRDDEYEQYMDCSYPSVSFDELNVFIYLFKNTLKA